MSIEAMKSALEDVSGAKLCEINSMSSRQEMLRLMDKADATLRAAIEEAEKQEKTVPLSEYLELQKLVTSQGIRLMEYESQQEPVSIQITDEMAFAFHKALGDGALGKEELEEIKTGLSAAIVNFNSPKREIDIFRDALTQISLCSANSMSSKEECGRIARAALKQS